MSRTTDPAVTSSEASDPASGYVCPFCGLAADTPDHDELTPCPRCGLLDSAATRRATRQRIGPWHVRQSKNPWAPGMRWETLVSLVRRGQVTPASILRGPTTHQLWRRASRVKGLSREWGICYSCGESIEKDANLCPHCNRLQEPPPNPDVLLESREPANASAPPPAPAPAPATSSSPSPASPLPTQLPAPLPRRETRASNGEPSSALSVSTADERTAAATASRSKPGTPVMRSTPAPNPDLLRRPAPPGEADALLTAQELATAFKLDFKPRSNRGLHVGRSGKIALVLLMLALSLAALAYVKPEYREAGWRWIQDKYDLARNKMTAASANPLPPTKTAQNSPAPAPAQKLASKPAAKPPLTIQHAPMPQPAAPVVEPKQKPIEIDNPAKPPAIQPKPAVAAASAPAKPAATAPLIVTTPAPVAKPTPAPAPVPTIDPIEKARTLWRKAIDAEGNQDFAEAAKCYEEIKKLPADAQPEGVDIRLEYARKQIRK